MMPLLGLAGCGFWFLRLQRAFVIFVRLQISQFGSLRSVYISCACLQICSGEEAPDEVVLEDLFCHFQRMLILCLPKFPQNRASLAIDLSVPSLHPDVSASTLWCQQNHLLTQSCQYHSITKDNDRHEVVALAKCNFVIVHKIWCLTVFPLIYCLPGDPLLPLVPFF